MPSHSRLALIVALCFISLTVLIHKQMVQPLHITGNGMTEDQQGGQTLATWKSASRILKVFSTGGKN